MLRQELVQQLPERCGFLPLFNCAVRLSIDGFLHGVEATARRSLAV
jgi:hypothetical protein